MSALAEILLASGHQVRGSDKQRTEITRMLEQKGAEIFEGHDAANLKQADYLVYSSAVKPDNPERQQALKTGIPQVRRAELLGWLFNRRTGIGIAGTHGKTSTASMLSSVLVEAGLDPSVIIGGQVKSWMSNARIGRGEILVAEADEYDRSFLALYPRMAVLTSLEDDHLDIYKDTDELKQAFIQFANQTAFDGSVTACADDENIRSIIPELHPSVITYGFSQEADIRAENLLFKESVSEFDVYKRNKFWGPIKINLPGRHNAANALAVCAAASELELDFEIVKQGLLNFKGTSRRFEILGRAGDILVVDDYAHHPTEIRASLQGARNGWQRRIIAVFQPHLFSRTRDFYKEFADALDLADLTLITEIYPAREKPMAGISGSMINNEMKSTNHFVPDKAAVQDLLKNHVQPGDMVIFIGAGDITQQAHLFYKQLRGEKNG